MKRNEFHICSVHGRRVDHLHGEHPLFPGVRSVYHSRVVMAEHLGRQLTKQEHIHHKDGNKLNDKIDNLEILSSSEHKRLHMRESPPKWNVETAKSMSQKSKDRCTPEWRAAVSERVKRQHAEGKFGRATWNRG